MKNLYLLLFLLLLTSRGISATSCNQTSDNQAQNENDSINKIVSKIKLPVIYIITEDSIEPTCTSVMHPDSCIGQSITDNNYVKGHMTIHVGDSIVFDSGDYIKKKSGMRLKVRGNTSADFPYKSFKVKTEVKTDLLNRSDDKYKSKAWVLLNIYSTRDLRTVTGFHLAKFMGIEWEPEYHFVNLIINGEYRGLYMLCESIAVSEGRCNIDKETGILIEDDAYWWNEDADKPVIKTNHLPYEAGYTFKNPDLSVDDPKVGEIKDYINAFEDSLYNGSDISRYIDLKSFATWILTHDLLGAWDGAGSNIYMMKHDFMDGYDKYKSKLCMGPLWDFDSIFKIAGKWAPIHGSDFFYFKELFKRPEFIEEYQKLWLEKHEDIASDITNFIEDFVAEYGEAIDESRLISPPGTSYWTSTTNDDLKEIRDWFDVRIPWMDNAISELFQAVSISQVYNDDIAYVTVFDINGRACYRLRGSEAERFFNNNYFKKYNNILTHGVYLVKAKYTDGRVVSRKYII